MARKRGKDAAGRLPPYLTYATWQKLLEALQKHTPSQLDRSYFDEFAFSTSTALTIRGTLLFLNLIDGGDKPNKTFTKLIESDGENRKPILKEIIQVAYQPILEGLDLDNATSGQLQERFRKHGAEGNIGRKCLSFFLALAKDADMILSPGLLRKSRVGAPRKASPRSSSSRRTREVALATAQEQGKEYWWNALLDKFPILDPDWSDDIKSKWFDDFRELIKVSAEQKPG
jgi:hypothetical protein